ncbi:uncharacterized protein LOC132067517 [Lycium ferocissimum]|uniref:uncharacterized protein LOC132067517 n=1 Tax=Lycium ferocissimum TaxID=112874 RepID=UPI002814C5DB|nr:uncharacterized protein LOC132067517 [Lycium ferocissimum]
MPKWIFILNLAAQRRLLTRDRLASWGITQDVMCPLCNDENETLNHLFFTCSYAASIWEKLLQWQGMARPILGWVDELHWATTNAQGNSATAAVYRMTLAACVYQVWKERNLRIFENKSRPPAPILRMIIQEVTMRGAMQRKLASKFEKLNFYP